jgi:hypothetical protein
MVEPKRLVTPAGKRSAPKLVYAAGFAGTSQAGVATQAASLTRPLGHAPYRVAASRRKKVIEHRFDRGLVGTRIGRCTFDLDAQRQGALRYPLFHSREVRSEPVAPELRGTPQGESDPALPDQQGIPAEAHAVGIQDPGQRLGAVVPDPDHSARDGLQGSLERPQAPASAQQLRGLLQKVTFAFYGQIRRQPQAQPLQQKV